MRRGRWCIFYILKTVNCYRIAAPAHIHNNTNCLLVLKKTAKGNFLACFPSPVQINLVVQLSKTCASFLQLRLDAQEAELIGDEDDGVSSIRRKLSASPMGSRPLTRDRRKCLMCDVEDAGPASRGIMAFYSEIQPFNSLKVLFLILSVIDDQRSNLLFG